ncbi:hypothetical protein HGRIS_002246 [Hohenbuehelia grisea]|uniref:DUF7082 domain-containing protein n=1 Tax=Hohenbuehelia grisea TaxID=104357 RepID=A0ABR3JKM9_9AGAR
MSVQSALLRYNRTRTPAPPLPTNSATPIMGRTPQITRRARSSSNLTAPDINGQTPVLQLLTPLDQMCQNWSASEMARGRRLVRFQKLQEGRRLMVSCQTVRQEDYSETETVISCIYREKTDEFYVTSVDIIYLLEKLTNDEFPVEEKNRIRRNLEGLRPTTVSKHKSGFEQFFQTIMDFPDPKPRNIEKDLKVFEWALLGQALDKILSKYIIYDPARSRSRSTSPKQDPVPGPDPEPEFTMDSDPPKDIDAPPHYTLDGYLAPSAAASVARHPYLEPLRLPLKQEPSLAPLLIGPSPDIDACFQFPESTSPVSTMMPETPTQPTSNTVRMPSDADLGFAAYWMEPQLVSDTHMFDFMDVVNQPKDEYSIDSMLNLHHDYKPY